MIKLAISMIFGLLCGIGVDLILSIIHYFSGVDFEKLTGTRKKLYLGYIGILQLFINVSLISIVDDFGHSEASTFIIGLYLSQYNVLRKIYENGFTHNI